MDSDRNVFIPAAAEIVFFFLLLLLLLPYGAAWRVVARCKIHLHQLCLVLAALSDCIGHPASIHFRLLPPSTTYRCRLTDIWNPDFFYYFISLMPITVHSLFSTVD